MNNVEAKNAGTEMYEVISLGEGFWAIQDGNVRMYLLDGGEKALLIDTGYGGGNLYKVVSTLVSGDIEVINTHSHGDHISGNSAFRIFYMGEADLPEIKPLCGSGSDIRLVGDHDLIRTGSVELEVIAIPGHTPGSIALLDRKNRRLFSADSVAKNFPIYMQYPGQDIRLYNQALHKLMSLREAYDYIYPCHGELFIDYQTLADTAACCDGILEGTIEPGTAVNADGVRERAYWKNGIAIFH